MSAGRTPERGSGVIQIDTLALLRRTLDAVADRHEGRASSSLERFMAAAGPGGSESSRIGPAPASPDTEPDAPLGAHRTPDPKDEP